MTVGLDSEKRSFSEKMRKERKKRGKEANLMLQSFGHIRDRFRMIMFFFDSNCSIIFI